VYVHLDVLERPRDRDGLVVARVVDEDDPVDDPLRDDLVVLCGAASGRRCTPA